MAKKKSRKRRSAAPGVDAEQRRRERLEARRQAKAEAEAARRRRQRRQRLQKVGLWSVAGAGVVWFLFLRGAAPTSIDGHTVQQFSRQGANDHVSGTVDYESTPPVSGAHAPGAAPCGVHGSPIQNELLVHTLEHGAVGLLYRPNLGAGAIADLEEIVRDYESHTLSAPYPDMETPIAVVSWGHMMELDAVDERAVREYIQTFRRKPPAPEIEQDCPNTQNEPFAPEPSPSPSPDKDKEDGGGG